MGAYRSRLHDSSMSADTCLPIGFSRSEPTLPYFSEEKLKIGFSETRSASWVFFSGRKLYPFGFDPGPCYDIVL
jgi:hypothetical protein